MRGPSDGLYICTISSLRRGLAVFLNLSSAGQELLVDSKIQCLHARLLRQSFGYTGGYY